MNIVPEVIVIIMSVVVLSLVRLRSFPSFLSFRGEAVRLYAQRVRKKKRRRDVISLSLSLSLFVVRGRSKKR